MGFIVIFAYDHTGERTLKMTGDATSVNQNAFNNHIYSSLNNVTLYPSPYLVLTNSGYTKHYYAGADRVCARIGSGGLNQDTTGIRGTSEISQCVDSLFLHCIEQMNNYVPSADTGNVMTIDGELLRDSNSIKTDIAPSSIHVDVVPNITRFNAVFDESFSENHSTRAPYYEPNVYFYHSDHLGGASWITNGDGNVEQHLQYLPFGQPFVNQHQTGYQERYTFTGKELDAETGYGYHGARYMDYELLTCWLSVDPMADKYPNISPYNYCMWNPIKLVDSDGEEAIDNDDWFQNTLTGAVYYNPSMSAQDVGTGAMRGEGWEHFGENNMFSNGDYSNTDIQLVMKYGGYLGVHDNFIDIQPSLILEGDKATSFMSDMGYSLQPQEAIVITTTRTTFVPEPHEPIPLTETNTSNLKVNKWGYEKKGLKGYPTVLKNISYKYDKTSVATTKETSIDLVKYNYRKSDGLKQFWLSVLRELLKIF